MEGRRQ